MCMLHAPWVPCVQVRCDKELLSKKSELLALEAERLKDANAALAAQLRTAQATVASLQAAAPAGSAGQDHAQRVALEREFGLVRDSNAMMRQREEAREAELVKLREQLKALEATVEPLRREKEVTPRGALSPSPNPNPNPNPDPNPNPYPDPNPNPNPNPDPGPDPDPKQVKQREAAALAGQLEEQSKENKQWQERVKRLLAKDRNSVGLEAHEQLVAQSAELQKEGEALRDQGKQAAAAKEKLEAELAASVQLVGRLKKAGGNFKAQLATANKELEELRTTAAADQAKAQLASNKDLEAQLAAAKATADEGEKKAAALGAELEQARTLCSRVR